MRKIILAAGLALACVIASASAHAQGYSAAALRVLARARAASGGSGWDFLRGWHETGRQGGAAYEGWFDPLRYGMRIETREPAGLHVRGFNGQGEWQILPTGATVGGDERRAVAEARTAAFLGAHGFFYPGRFDASGEYLGRRKDKGHGFDVVGVRPWGGQPRELWFDRSSAMLSRIVDRAGPRPVTVELSDYRRVGPVRIAFRQSIDDGTPGGAHDSQLESLAFPPADRALFSLPRPTASAALPPSPTRP